MFAKRLCVGVFETSCINPGKTIENHDAELLMFPLKFGDIYGRVFSRPCLNM